MATIKKPKNRKGIPPTIEEASNNLSNDLEKIVGVKKDLNFKVNIDFKRRFKRYATDNDITMQSLLVKAFEYYEEHHKE